MSKLTRVVQKLFGSTAAAGQIGQFGSLAAGSPATTTDPTVIQSLSNYLGGWFSAIVGGNSPAIEDLNALCFLYSYQLAYLMQAGIPEWETGTIYYTGSLVQSAGILYISIADSNTGNAVSNGSFWSLYAPAAATVGTLALINASVTASKMAASSVDLGTSVVLGTLPQVRGGTGNNSIITGGTGGIGSPAIVSGSYTPTMTSTTNMATPNFYPAQWSRVGNTVTVSGKVDLGSLSVTAAATLSFSLPTPGMGAFATDDELAGVISTRDAGVFPGAMFAVASGVAAAVVFAVDPVRNYSITASLEPFSYTFQYRVK